MSACRTRSLATDTPSSLHLRVDVDTSLHLACQVTTSVDSTLKVSSEIARSVGCSFHACFRLTSEVSSGAA